MRLPPSPHNREGRTVQRYPKRKVEVQGAATAKRLGKNPTDENVPFCHVPKLVRNSVFYLFLFLALAISRASCLLLTYIQY